MSDLNSILQLRAPEQNVKRLWDNQDTVNDVSNKMKIT